VAGGLIHLDDAPSYELSVGHLHARWSDPGRTVGSVTIGMRRIRVPAGSWSTPAHEHDEEIFYVLAGRGLSWHRGKTCAIGSGDCIVYPERGGAHTIHATDDIDLLAFGPRSTSPGVSFPRLGRSLVAGRWLTSEPASRDNLPIQFVEEAELGAPELPDEPAERPSTVVNVDAVEPYDWGNGRVSSLRRDLGLAAGSVGTGIKHAEVPAGRDATPLHCHSVEEEMFVVLSGSGELILGDAERTESHAVSAGSVVSRPAATGISHMFRAGDEGMTFIGYGPREPSDLCYYPASNKISFRGLGVVARIERLDYWDGEG
jgi:uncharacterized cupin superfamily protein